MKKKILWLLFLLIGFNLNILAQQVPAGINYQAIARDTAGNPLSQQSLTIKLSILSGSPTGSLTWQETHSVTTNNFGQYRLVLGQGTSTGSGSAATFSAINWGIAPYYLKTEMNAGSGFINMGTDPFESVPYALYAKNVSSLPTGTNIGQVLSWNGNAWVATDVCTLLPAYYRDLDNDGFGNPASIVHACFLPSGYATINTDCNDNVAAIHPGATETCNSIDDNCDGLTDNGVISLTDVNNCGNCNVVCPARANATTICTNGVCGFTCLSGFADCNGAFADGCETNLNSTVNACGNCSNVCPAPANATPVCQQGFCSYICNSGFGDCDGNTSNGCETNLNTNFGNCGSCGNSCSFPNANSACNLGICAIVSCNTGFKNCNGLNADGCEININSDPANCGNCGVVCSAPHAIMGCNAGVCFIAVCSGGFGNCNGIVADGCEVTLATNQSNCGFCGNNCSVPNSSGTCVAGACGLVCNTGFKDCNGIFTDGCETNITTSVNNCGNCGVVCSRANAVMGCSGGVCFIASCNAGFADCNGSATDGCEVNITNNNNNCGSCGHVCAVSTPTCSGSTCH